MSLVNLWNNFSNDFGYGAFNTAPYIDCYSNIGCSSWDNLSGGFNSYYDDTSLFMMPAIPQNTFSSSLNFGMQSIPDFTGGALSNGNLFNFSSFGGMDTFQSQSSAPMNFTFPPLTFGTSTSSGSTGAQASGKYADLINKYAKQYNLEPNFVKAVIKAESGFNPNSCSEVGAKGLMQLMPDTAKELGVSNPYDPEQNIRGGAKYLRQMLDRYNGNKRLALAAYNAGPARVKNGKIPKNGQTPAYVNKVMKYYSDYNQA